MPRLKEELQFPDRSNTSTIAPLTGLSLINENGVLKILHADGTKETVKTSDDLDETFHYSNYYTKEEVQQILTNLGAGVQVKICESDPTNSIPDAEDMNKIFLVPATINGVLGYKEYLYVNNTWEEVGNTDLSGYLTTTEFNRQKEEGLAKFRDWEV
jgi:hypothetical protein